MSVPRENATIMIAIDTSRSMAAKDVPPTRMEAARKSIREFLAKAPDTYRVGVVSFASAARVVAPPTRDRELVELALRELRAGEGTALGDAIAKAVEVGQAAGRTEPGRRADADDGPAHLRRQGGRWEHHAAARPARWPFERGVPVNTVALGTADGVVEVPLAGGFTARVQVPPDPNTLRARRADDRRQVLRRARRPSSSRRCTPTSSPSWVRRRSGAR